MSKKERKYDLIIYGASGFTGRLVAEHLVAIGVTNFALAGRNFAKLSALRAEIEAPPATGIIEANSDDMASLEKMCASGRVIVSTVGPYQLYGSTLVAACAATGTDYLDLCGEPTWMRQMLDQHEQTARESGARVVFSCGFDSIPSDLGVFVLQQNARRQFGAPAPRVKCRVRAMRGEASGGTMASMKATLRSAVKNPALLETLNNPFALTPGFTGPAQPSGLVPEYDAALGVWAAPFVMATINTKNVHRSNFLLGHLYGRDFVYDEMILTTIGEAGRALLDSAIKALPFSRSAYKPGEGPSRAERESGYYDILFTGEYPNGNALRLAVKGDRDPGYGSTSKMMGESALALLASDAPGGFYTPASILADALLEALPSRAGVSFIPE